MLSKAFFQMDPMFPFLLAGGSFLQSRSLFDKLAFAASIETVKESRWTGAAAAEIQFCLLVK